MRITSFRTGCPRGALGARLEDCLDEEIPQGLAGPPLGLPGPQGCRPLLGPLPGQALLEWGWGVRAGLAAQQLIILFRPLPGDVKSLGPTDSAPKPVRPVVWEKGAPGRGSRRCQKRRPIPAQGAEPLGLWMLWTDPRTDKRLDACSAHGAWQGTVSAADGTVAAAGLPPDGDEPG